MKITPKREERLIRYLNDHVLPSEDLFANRIQAYTSYVKRYEAKSIRKHWPWPGASSVHVPIVAIVMDSIKARILNALFAQDKVINCIPVMNTPIGNLVDPQTGEAMTWRTVAELAEIYMNFEIGPAGQIDFRGFVESLIDDMLMFGTAFPRAYWETIVSSDMTPDGQRVDHISYDNMKFDVPPIEQIRYPAGYPDFERIPWFSYIYSLRPSEILHRIGSTGWHNVNTRRFLENAPPASFSEIDETYDEMDGMGGDGYYDTDEKTIAQTWMRFDWDGSGKESRIVVDHSWSDTQELYILNVRPWPNDAGVMDFVGPARYIRRRNRLSGMGLPERLESLDEAYSTAINQMIDNVTVANCRMWSVNSNSPAARSFGTIYPNKVVYRDEPQDIQPLQLGEVYPSSFEVPNIINANIEKLAKLNDYNLGRESSLAGKVGPATSTLALLQEVGQYHESTTRDIRRILNLCLQQWMNLMAQNQPVDRVGQILGDRAKPFLAALVLGSPDISKRLAVQVSFSSNASTRELARQEGIAKLTMMRDYYTDLVTMRQVAQQDPSAIPLLQKIGEDYYNKMRAVLDEFGETDTSTTLPKWEPPTIQPQPGLGEPGTGGEPL